MAAGSGNVRASRSGWVAFSDEPVHTGPRHSVCSSASFWSSAPASEGAPSEELSSASMDASSGDLPSLSTEEPPSHGESPPHSPHSSVCLEDDGVNMDTLNWTTDSSHTNGQSNAGMSRFASWVTFDDDDDDVKEPAYHPTPKPSSIRIGNLNSFRLQDTNSNLIVSSVQNSSDRHILDLTPDRTDSVFFESPLLNSSTPYTKKNPFLHEDFSNISPSSINPFSAYFSKTALTSSDSHETQGFFDSSLPNPDTQRDSTLFFSTVEGSDGGTETGTTYFSGHLGDSLDPFKSMQISDPDQEPSLPEDTVDAGDVEEIPYVPSHMAPQDGWPMLLRIPEKKNIMSSRHWGPIFVRLSDAGQLRLYYEKGLEKHFKEFQLSTQLEISEHKMQHYEENGRVHTLSLDQVVYKEKRKIQPKVSVVHTPVKEQLVKLGTTDYQDFLSFRYALQEKLAVLSADVDAVASPVPYSEEEMQVEVLDLFYGVLSKDDNHILQQLVTTRISVLAFLTSSTPCRIGLNDIQVKGKEVVSRHDIIPNTTTRWIRLRDCRLHKCADEAEFTESRTISFEPPSGRRFDLLRFRTAYAEKTLPFTLRTVVSVRGAEVELQSWLVMSTGFLSNRDPLTLIPCENIAIRYPIPETWAKNFRRESVTGEKSLKARFNKGASFGSVSTSGSEPAMRVTLGTAKYEQAFRAVVWRISRLPDKNSALGHPHTFFCRLELGSDREVPDKFQSVLEVEFDMPAASASKTTVRSLSVRDRAELKKWITYKAHYSYQVEIEQKNEGVMEHQDQDHVTPCAQQ
ncbi:stonin-2 isoform X2 [Tachysurus fulvidraco]|uniref:stonin-2 isoform X2 n=1 Tax=Tachysurus fulvidraco TaxID=1234273 RepID=UPI001FEFBE2D|nr:stonin-2 isoform X2 [Tachysurus fulvidraco]